VTLGLVAVGAAPETAPADQLVQAPVAASTGTASAGLVAITERPAIALRRSAPPRASRSRHRAVRPAVSHRRTVPRRAARVRSAADDTCSGPGWRERRGRAALASLRADAVSGPGARFEFAEGRSGYLGLTYLQERRIVLYIRSCSAESASLLRHVAAHELGHAFDGAYMSSAQRADWMRARGISSGTPWFGCGGCTDFATPAGDFAEVYAQWARGGGDNRSRMAGRPGPAELSALARTFFHA
jgi:hypothetical protein